MSGRFHKTSELLKKTPELEEEEEDQEDLSDYKASKNQKKLDEAEQTDEDQKSDIIEISMEGSRPALPAEPGTLKATLLDTPSNHVFMLNQGNFFKKLNFIDIGQITEPESAHPSAQQLHDIATALEESKVISDITNGEADITEIAVNDKASPIKEGSPIKRSINTRGSIRVTPASNSSVWHPTPEWVI